MQLPPELPIPDEDWGQTPPAVQAVVIALWLENQALAAQVAALEAGVAKLREQVGKNSTNSSKPPSSDPPSVPPKQKVPTGRKPGGQRGHEGHGRPLKPPGEVQRFVEAKPVACAHCGTLLMGDDPNPERHQTVGLPPIKPVVTEYRKHTLKCMACGEITEGEWPPEMPGGDFDPGVMATVGFFTGRMGISQRDTKEVMESVFHVDVGLGTIPALEREVSVALAEPVAQAQDYVRQQPVANVDETSWAEGRCRPWVWAAVTGLVTIFRVLGGRGQAQAQELLGRNFSGNVGSDRLGAYNWLDVKLRQICWAHLIRDFVAFICRGGVSERIGDALLEQAGKMFDLWRRVRDGTLQRPALQEAMVPIQKRVGELLREGAECDYAATRNTCRNILKLEEALWTFVTVPGVEPTNNIAERALRRLVLWRRRSFGTKSEAGSRFVERTMTAVATLRQQKRDVLDYLTEACAAAIRGDRAPSLLPDHSVVSQG
jgi:transposase